MQQIYLNSCFRGFEELANYAYLHDHPQKDIIERRLKIIAFFDEFGERATKEAFLVSRSTVFLWKKKLRETNGKLTSLVPKSRAPLKRRKRETPLALVAFIKDYRRAHPGVSKETIKPALDRYCLKEGLPSISESTVGRVIKDLKEKKLIPQSHSSVSYNATRDKFYTKTTKRKKKLRRKGFTPSCPGGLVQLDAISIFTGGIKRYILTAIDLKTAFAFAYSYDSLNSCNARDFLEKMQCVSPFVITCIQTDNGGEFAKHFGAYIEKEGITHFHTYPRHPQSNAHVERFNRTIKEQHVRWHMDLLYDTDEFNRGLMDYLLWYNTEKPHRSLNKHPPLRYYVDNFTDTKSNMLWTLTEALHS